MGAYNQIEIYPRFGNNDQREFLNHVRAILNISTNKEHENEIFIKSINLIIENQDSYFKYQPMVVKFWNEEDQEIINWHIDLFNWPNQINKFEIRLGVPSEKIIQINPDNSVTYKFDILVKIEELMDQIHKTGENQLILFTDEGNEGEFENELNGKPSTVNYLFDLAIIPNWLKWNYNGDNYELITEGNKFVNIKSKHKYMNIDLF